MKTYKYPIEKLEPHQIFVFGSNTEGRHGKGAALWARKYAGAIYGKPEGLQGQSYAIVTKDLTKSTHPSIDMMQIIHQIGKLYLEAELNPEKEYLIAYSVRPNLNGYTVQQMAEMFSIHQEIPENIVFEEEFSKLIQ